MELMNRVITGGYWGAYYLVYVVGMVYLLYHFRRELRFPEAGQADVDTLFVGAAICGVSGGTALFVAIIVEVTGRMVLLIPRAWNKAKDLGRAEGLTEGLTAGPGGGPCRWPHGGPGGGTGPGAGHPVPVCAAGPGDRGTGPGPGRRGTPAQRRRQREGLGLPDAASGLTAGWASQIMCYNTAN